MRQDVDLKYPDHMRLGFVIQMFESSSRNHDPDRSFRYSESRIYACWVWNILELRIHPDPGFGYFPNFRYLSFNAQYHSTVSF